MSSPLEVVEVSSTGSFVLPTRSLSLLAATNRPAAWNWSTARDTSAPLNSLGGKPGRWPKAATEPVPNVLFHTMAD